jgi:CDP-diacylglycerol--glycerol-3-phosphate 3-phosphatidyltransferase
MSCYQSKTMSRETVRTWANLATAIRVVACTVIFGWAFAAGSAEWNFIGLGVYWALDVVDGYLARRFDQETRIGAQFDILADRLLVCLFYVNYVVANPSMIVAVLLFLFQFMVIDHFLSNQFMRWPLRSPNYFYLVDRRLWALNWSASGKLLNTAVVTIVLVGTRSVWLGSAAAIAIIGLKVFTLVRLLRLPDPEAGWPAIAQPATIDEEQIAVDQLIVRAR